MTAQRGVEAEEELFSMEQFARGAGKLQLAERERERS